MEKLALSNAIVFVVISCICMLVGLDLRKWSSWIIGLYGFLSGFWIGTLGWGNPSEFPIKTGLQMGLLFTFVVMSGGAMNRYHQQRYKTVVKEWLSLYGDDEKFTLLARIMRKILRE